MNDPFSGGGRALQVLLLVTFLLGLESLEAVDTLDPHGNITIKWDVLSRLQEGDGYKASITIYNHQEYRHVEAPGWTLGWNWAGDETIKTMRGAQAMMQGDCSRIREGEALPHSCARNPVILDLLPGAELQTANCCRGGLLSAFAQHPENSVAYFEMEVGHASFDRKPVSPVNFAFGKPGPGYVCRAPEHVNASLFPSEDGRRSTQALMTLRVTCVYDQQQAQTAPTCCVSFSSFYNRHVVPCRACACGCSSTTTCIDSNDVNPSLNSSSLHCSKDMCPVRIHWHVEANYKEYWRAKATITNRRIRNYNEWNLVVQHPNFRSLSEVFSFQSKALTPYAGLNDTSMFFGIEHYNDMLLQNLGYVQSEMLFEKSSEFTLSKGWAFPHKVLFNGDECVLPSAPHMYPSLPSQAYWRRAFDTVLILACLVIFL